MPDISIRMIYYIYDHIPKRKTSTATLIVILKATFILCIPSVLEMSLNAEINQYAELADDTKVKGRKNSN